MAITENDLGAFRAIFPYVDRIYAASGEEDLINAASEYLGSWSKQKIEKLQSVDGGWGPFDRYGQSTRLRTVAQVTWIAATVRRQLLALKEFGIAPNSELVELDVFFAIAKQVAEDRIAIRSRTNSGTAHRGDYPQ